MRQTGALLTLLLAGVSLLQAGDNGITGNWRLSLIEDGAPTALWLVKLDDKGGKLTADIEGLRRMPPSTISDIKIEGDRLYFSIGLKGSKGASIPFEGVLPKAGGKKILGSIPWGREETITPVVLDFTTAKNAFEVEKDVVAKTPGDPRVFPAVQELILKAPDMKIPAKDVKEWLEVGLKLAEKHGPRLAFDTAMGYAEDLLKHEPYAQLAADTLRRADKALPAKSSAEEKLRVLGMLTRALKKAGDTEAIKALQPRMEALEPAAHEEYQKELAKLKPAKFAGRKGKSNRAVLVELFTGAACPPCVAADVAFDVLGKTFQPTEAVFLQYHLHIPLPDALVNADSETRAEYYSPPLRGTPTYFLNGKIGPDAFGSLVHAEDRYKDYREEIEPLLEKPAAVRLTASATRQGDKIQIKASAQGLAKPGEKVRLRVAVTEDWARYRGGNGLSFHHHIVRAMPGGPEGTALTKKDTDKTFDVDVAKLRQGLVKYLDDFQKKRDKRFPDDQRPLALRDLKVVVFVQNDENREVLQAVEATVKGE